ncbi:MAG: type IX secretion system sortase PorU [Bacteroidota bacterium]
MKKAPLISATAVLTLFFSILHAAESKAPIKINWTEPQKLILADGLSHSFICFTGAQYNLQESQLPFYYETRKLNGPVSSLSAELLNPVFVSLAENEKEAFDEAQKSMNLPPLLEVQVRTGIVKKQNLALIKFYPFRINPASGQPEKLLSFTLKLNADYNLAQRTASSTAAYAANSVLASGNWYKVGLTADGIYKMDYAYLLSLGMNLSGKSPQDLRVYGNGGGQLPYSNAAPRIDDLAENAIYVFDGGTLNVFDSADYVLFYGQSQNRWSYTASTGGCPAFRHSVHLFSDTTYYFITTDLGPGKRVSTQSSSTLPVTNNVNTFDDYAFHESDASNMIKSGREWYGEKFDILNTYTFNFSFPGIDPSSPVYVKTEVIGRADVTSSFTVTSGSGSTTLSTTATQTSIYYYPYAYTSNGCFSYLPSSSNISVTVTRTSPLNNPNFIGYLNYVEVNARRQLLMSTPQLIFRDAGSVGAGNVSKFFVANANSNLSVWEVTDPVNVAQQAGTLNGNVFEFALPTDSLREFLAFDGSTFLTPRALGAVPNQNLHAIGQMDMIIVCPPVFWNEATQLANLHANEDGLSVGLVTPQQIYNEFSSGARDVSAIRDFMKMLYERAADSSQLPRYLLLYGDGSYDNKQRLGNNTDFVITYQSVNSLDPINSYVSDDFFVQLDSTEGVWGPSDADLPDLGVGRMPVKSVSESQAALNKIIKYRSVPGTINTSTNSCSNPQSCSSFGDWRNVLCFVADDEDNGVHVTQAQAMANYLDTAYDQYNIDKIYFDSYQQVATPGGARYPNVVDAINQRIDKGCLIFNYTGHGGEIGLAHERVIEIPQINSWDNICNMPLMVTATCEFSRWEDPERTSAGEYCFLNPNGAAIGLFTTTRLVFSGPNFTLNNNMYRYAFDSLPTGEMPRIGDLNFLTKSTLSPDLNYRNFTLLCDPALMLAYPMHTIVTKTVNGQPVNLSQPDTVRALGVVTITGEVHDDYGNKLTGYNGVIYPTVFDKSVAVTTLSNDGTSSPAITFQLQKNVLYKGKVSVVNGDFSFTFVVPKDIAYAFGPGRISYYGHNGQEDAAGYYENIVIGGTDTTAPADNTGPVVKLYMNDDKFVSGGITDKNPDIYAVVSDSNGVNTVGNGIGHDIAAVLDANTDNTLVLNDYYEADLNSYKSGTVRYPLNDLDEGLHSLNLKVWDVYNNSSVAYTEFVVAADAILALDHVLNYPNPFTTKTSFYFEHNKPCNELEIQIQIFTVSGKLVKTINTRTTCDGYKVDGIEWDGKDDFGDAIGKGVYIYRVKVRTPEGETADKYEKLVILK